MKRTGEEAAPDVKRTAPNLNIEPRELKRLVDAHGLEGAVLLAVRGETFQVVSWGKDKTQCKRFGRITEDIGTAIQEGGIDIE